MSDLRVFRAPERTFSPVALDESQRAVVEMPTTASASVLGAPGTGKTATLIELVAARVASGSMTADQVLVLTPQRHAANRLRIALAERLAVPTNGPLARTPMSLAFSLAVEGAFARGVEPPSMLTGSEQDAILAALLELETPGVVWPDSLGYDVRQTRTFRSELRDLLARCVGNAWSADDLARHGRERDDAAWVAVAAFWQHEYEPALADLRQDHFDAATLLAQGAVALADPRVLAHTRLVVIDDAHELTRGAHALVRAFIARQVPVVLFGDPDVAATTFRGADPSIVGGFAQVAPHALEFVLDTSYRQAGPAAELVRRITERVGTAQAGRQRAARAAAEVNHTALEIIERPSGVAELIAVARRLRECHVYDEVPFARMAVVLRSGSQVAEVARILALNEVPTRTLVSDRSLRDHAIVRDLLRVVEVGLGRRTLDSGATADAHTAVDILLSPLCALSIVDVRRLRVALRHDELALGANRTGAQLLPLALAGQVPVAHLSMRSARVVASFATLLAELRAATDATIEELLWKVWTWSALEKRWGGEASGTGVIADEANRNLDAVLALFTAAKRAVERDPQRAPGEFIASVLGSDVPEDTLASQASSDAVLVCTPAAAIGAEFDVVSVASLQEGRWPNLRPRGSLFHGQNLDGVAAGLSATDLENIDERKQVLDDELRMFALAASRARRLVVLSAASGHDEAPSPVMRVAQAIEGVTVDATHNIDAYPLSLRGMVGHLRRQLTQDLRTHQSVSETAHETARALAELARHEVPGADPVDWYGLIDPSTLRPLAELDEGEKVSVSPSRLDSWEKNQFGWFLDGTVGWQGSTATGVGTLVHEIFEQSVRSPELSIDPHDMWTRIKPRWAELAIEPAWESEREKKRVRKMLDALSDYIAEFRASGREVIGVETHFSLAVGRGKLTGTVDRFEQHPDGSVTVVDLKTSKNPISKDEAQANIQLACYQFALVNDAFIDADQVDASVIPERLPSAGATLLYLNKDSGDTFTYQTREQAPIEALGESVGKDGQPITVEGVRALIEGAVEGMAGSVFTAIVYTREEIGEFDSGWSKRIHVVQAVSA